jgi:hypothetical protein
MGFLGKRRDPAGPDFMVPELHVNLLLLPGLFGRQVILIDLGIHLQVDAGGPLTTFEIALPAGTDPEGLTDIAKSLETTETAQLIFGERVSVEGGSLRFEDGTSVPLCNISKTGTKRDAQKSTVGFSHWRIELAHPVASRGYLRLRFRVLSRGRMLLKRGFGMFASRILIDFRISDLRESWTVPDGPIYRDALVPIQKLYFFVVLPARFHDPSMSPRPRYMRILEGTLWEPYLQRAVYLLRQGKMTVYSWRAESITITAPFRVFLDVTRDTRLRVYYLLLAAVVTVLTLLLVDPSLISRSTFFELLGRLWVKSRAEVFQLLGVTSLGGLVVWLLRRQTTIRGALPRIRRMLIMVESAMYRQRMR